jgi:hypothetical protein
MTSESGNNTSGQEAFGSKAKETLVAESPTVSTADLMSAASGSRVMAASEADKAGTSTTPATEEEGGDLFMADPLPTLDPHAAEAGGTHVEDDVHRCLYVGTPWEAEVIADRRDVDEFKEASRIIELVLAVRFLAKTLNFLLWVVVSRESLKLFCLLVQSIAERAQARAGLLREAASVHAEAAAAREAKLQAQVEAMQEIQRVKEAMARQAQKEAVALKKKLEVAKQKAKDAASDLQVMIEGMFPRSAQVNSVHFVSPCC